MTVREIFGGICGVREPLGAVEAAGVTSDSREVKDGYVFVCIKGEHFDGHKIAGEIAGRCAAIVTQEELGLPNEVNVADSRRIYPQLLSNFYGNPTRYLKICAVTGTNGKTTVANLCAEIIRILGHKCGIIGTLGTDNGKGLVYSHDDPPTTPEPRRLYELFAEMRENGMEYCSIEASSQALAQYRFSSEKFDSCVFTNLTRDHLDYHKTMENYFLAKQRLFDICRSAAVNIDDEYGRRIAEYCRENGVPIYTVSTNGKADYYTEFVRFRPDGSEFVLTDSKSGKSYPVQFAMTGAYNVMNAVEAAVSVHLTGIPMDEVISALERVRGVPGRMETLYSGEFTVIRDFAHTEDGLRQLLSSLKPLTENRLITLFGAAGERDTGKRPGMGSAAAEYSDYLIVTVDNPRNEDLQKTIDDVVRGIPDSIPHEEFLDRKSAIIRALEMARSGDVVALCGKGHEDYQAIGNECFHFDEREIVEEYFKK